MNRQEALRRTDDPIARRGIRALYRLSRLLSQEELSNLQAEMRKAGLQGMRAVAFLEHCLKEAQNV